MKIANWKTWLRTKLYAFLEVDRFNQRLTAVENTMYENSIEAEDAFKQMFARLEELEESYAQGYIKQGTPKETDTPVVLGFTPFSVRRKRWEADHQPKLNSTAQQIVRNSEAMKGK